MSKIDYRCGSACLVKVRSTDCFRHSRTLKLSDPHLVCPSCVLRAYAHSNSRCLSDSQAVPRSLLFSNSFGMGVPICFKLTVCFFVMLFI